MAALAISIVILLTLFTGLGLLVARIDFSHNSRDKVTPVYTPKGTAFVVDATARSIQTGADVTHLSKVTLEGRLTLQILGVTIADATGARMGPGSLTVIAGSYAKGGRIAVRGNGLTLHPYLLTLPRSGPATIDTNSSQTIGFAAELGEAGVTLVDGATIKAADFSFHLVAGADRAVKGPVRIISQEPPTNAGSNAEPLTARVMPSIDSLRWLDPPELVTLDAHGSRSVLSWAGPSTVTMTADRRSLGRFGGMLTSTFEAKYERGSGALDGTGLLTQLFKDGKPLLRTKGGVERLTRNLVAPITQADVLTSVEPFDWAPFNDGQADMCITRIVPVSAAARWVSLGLSPLPGMRGGEEGLLVGGNTEGFIGGSGIRSVIRPGEADRRTIGVHVPRGTPAGSYPIVIELRGNFSPIRITVMLTVV